MTTGFEILSKFQFEWFFAHVYLDICDGVYMRCEIKARVAPLMAALLRR
jgi:hypothetical protein